MADQTTKKGHHWRDRSAHDVRTFVGRWEKIPCFCWADSQHDAGHEVRTRPLVNPSGATRDSLMVATAPCQTKIDKSQ